MMCAFSLNEIVCNILRKSFFLRKDVQITQNALDVLAFMHVRELLYKSATTNFFPFHFPIKLHSLFGGGFIRELCKNIPFNSILKKLKKLKFKMKF